MHHWSEHSGATKRDETGGKRGKRATATLRLVGFTISPLILIALKFFKEVIVSIPLISYVRIHSLAENISVPFQLNKNLESRNKE